MFCFDKFCFLLLVGYMLEQNVFGIPDLNYWVDNIMISADIKICLHLISITTQPNGLPTSYLAFY